MNQLINKLKTDWNLTIGLTLLFFSTVFYGVTLPYHDQEFGGDSFSLFIVHFASVCLYIVVLGGNKVLRLHKPFHGDSRDYHLILLMLFNISAYALNHSIPVFYQSADWLTVFLIIEQLLLLSLILFPNLSRTTANVFLFLSAIFLIFNLYQTIVILPYILLGVIASFFFGISLHALVPVYFVIAFFKISLKLEKSGGKPYFMAAGTFFVLCIVGIYSWQWHQINQTILKTESDYHFPGADNEFPLWVQITQNLPDHLLIEKILKSDFIYQTNYQDNWDIGRLQFQKEKVHDPLVGIASIFNQKIDLDSDERLKILNALYDTRHESADRFWSGKNLVTDKVISNVQLYPSYRLAYTEMILMIDNELYQQNSRWFNQQEALYTFQLPPGSTVTSMSLWINDYEAQARLTTKKKAENAYNTIVGREVRDPSVVYWMEGNQVRVRVFPCTPSSKRKLKIGLTSPLQVNDDQLIYSSLTFKGPSPEKAHTSVNLLVENNGKITESTLHLKPSERNERTMSWTGNYPDNWSVKLEKPALANVPFNYKGQSYRVKELETENQNFSPESVYLDIHRRWSASDLEEMMNALPFDKFHLYDYKLSKMKKMDKKEVLKWFGEGNAPQFALFPFHKVKNPEKALLITRSNLQTPNMADLDKSEFKRALFKKLCCTNPVKVFDLEDQPTAYLASLLEFKTIHYQAGSLQQLKDYFNSKKFPLLPQTENGVSIATAHMEIIRADQSKAVDLMPARNQKQAVAPDHLLRLFSYNQVMKQIGQHYFKKDYLNEEVIKEAELAHIVTPVSSLIVLETLKDYERFGIDDNKDTLGNASIKNTGAVPEPHEWALIIVGALFIGYVGWKRWKKNLNLRTF